MMDHIVLGSNEIELFFFLKKKKLYYTYSKVGWLINVNCSTDIREGK